MTSRCSMNHYLPWLLGGLAAAMVIAALIYARMSQVESDQMPKRQTIPQALSSSGN
jgi:predicted outer membrane lipoprotein